MLKPVFLLLSLLPALISAANDNSTPCFSGQCTYDIPSSETSMAGTMILSGSPNAISDITSAAGWEILNCTSNSNTQDIRLICTGDEASCSHVVQNGAEHTIVRLPPNCGSTPFARVSQFGESDDQSLPERISSHIKRRDGTAPSVHTLSFDTKFDEIPPSQHGTVSLLVFGSTIPGFTGNGTITPPGSRRRSRLLNKRGLFDSLLGDFNKTTQTDLPPIDIDKSFNIFNTTLSCSANEEAKLSVDVNAKLDAKVSIGAVLAGSVVPPKIKEFGLFSDISADLDGGITVDANIAGEVDTGKVPLFSVGLPGLDIDGILSLGPTFEIDAEAKATVDLDVNMAVDLAYSFSDLQLFFPPSDGHPSNAVVAPKDTPLKLSASPDVQSNATLEAHLILTLKFGISAFSAKADVFVDLDTFAALDLGLEAGATGSVDTNGDTGASAQIGGCVDVNGGVSVDAGAEGSFFGLFDDNTTISLFTKKFDLFKKCFDESTSTTSSAAPATSSTSTFSVLPSSSVLPTSLQNVSSNLTRSISASADGQVSQSAITSSSSFTPSASSFEVSDSATSSSSIASAIPGSVSSSNASSSPSVTSTLTTTNSAPASSSSTKSGAAKRSKVPSRHAKRDFQCLASDIAPAASIIDQTISGSSLTS